MKMAIRQDITKNQFHCWTTFTHNSLSVCMEENDRWTSSTHDGDNREYYGALEEQNETHQYDSPTAVKVSIGNTLEVY